MKPGFEGCTLGSMILTIALGYLPYYKVNEFSTFPFESQPSLGSSVVYYFGAHFLT